MVQPTMSTFTDERELFYYTVKNITKDRTRCNYWVSNTSHVSSLLLSIPYHEPTCSIGYLPFSLTSLSTSYCLYRPIFIYSFFPLITQNIYRDIPNNFPYSIRKFNIIMIYQLKKYSIQYSLQKESLLIRNLRHFHLHIRDKQPPSPPHSTYILRINSSSNSRFMSE